MRSPRHIETGDAPAAIGPYSQAVVAGQLVFVSGQIPLLPDGTGLVPGGVAEQTRQVLRNLQAILNAAGLNLEQVVKTTCYLTDLSAFTTFNDAYAEFFGEGKPARATVEVASLPRGALVEIDAIAVQREP